jgi:hypothetical protein
VSRFKAHHVKRLPPLKVIQQLPEGEWIARCPLCELKGFVEPLEHGAGEFSCAECDTEEFGPGLYRLVFVDEDLDRNGHRPGRELVLTCAQNIHSERQRWLWEGRLPLGGPTAVAGEKGKGKSTLTNAWLAARATRGELEGDLEGQPIDVLILTAEDHWAAQVKPRLQAHGADMARVHRVEVQEDKRRVPFSLPADVELVEKELANWPWIRLVIVDPIGAFLTDKTNSHTDASVRRALYPLAELAEGRELAVLVVMHFNKDETSRLIHRVTGAGAFVNAVRSVLALVDDPNDPDGEQGSERVLIPVACNWGRLAAPLSVSIESHDLVTDDGELSTVSTATINGESDVKLEDLQGGQQEGAGPSDHEEAIGQALKDTGSRPSLEVKQEVKAELDCSFRTVERAAVRMQRRGELVITKSGFPATTTWSLVAPPSGDTAQ